MAWDEKAMQVGQMDSEGSRRSLISVPSIKSIGRDSTSDTQASSPTSRPSAGSRLGLTIGFLIIFSAVSGALGFCAFYFTRARETDAYQSSFGEDALYLIDDFNALMLTTRIEALSYAFRITPSTSTTSSSWPFATLNADFEASTFSILRHSLATAAFFAPFVSADERVDWEAFAASARPDMQYVLSGNRSISDGIYTLEDGIAHDDMGSALYYSPVWNVAPSNQEMKYLMFNQASDEVQGTALHALLSYKSIISSAVFISDAGTPYFFLFIPIFENLEREKVVASLSLLMDIRTMFGTRVARGARIDVVLDSSSGQHFTFQVVGASDGAPSTVIYLGEGDLHDSRYDDMLTVSSPQEQLKAWDEVLSTAPKAIADFYPNACQEVAGEYVYSVCGFNLRLYPTEEYESAYQTSYPITVALAVSLSLFFAASLILGYCFLVERRQQLILRETKRERAIDVELVKSFYPKFIRDRLALANNGKRAERMHQPIAEQFQETTVMFADMVGFTAWSSEREPEEVFLLLEAVYERFDLIANQLGVFKVETIGDCYMAAVGLPQPNRHHAVVAAQFALECLHVMKEVTTNLETQLGPGTASIGLRVGLHSGTVTGGVLRGERSRFQLFGDTVNTASRMESNGVPGRIQVSQATADLLIASGKQHWLIPRKEMIQAKGKGRMQVYFVERRRKLMGHVSGYAGTDSTNAYESDDASECESLNCSTPNTSSCITRDERLIEWNTDLLLASLFDKGQSQDFVSSRVGNGLKKHIEAVRSELRVFITYLATIFPDRPYHNFEHASISAMFANTLMKQAFQNLQLGPDGSKKHDPSIGIAHFATLLAVLLHDIRYPSDGRRPCLLPAIMSLLRSDEYESLASALFHAPVDENTFTSIFSTCLHGFPVYNAEGDENSLSSCCVEAQTHDGDNDAILPHGMTDAVKLVIKSSEIAHWFQHWNTYSVWHGKYFAEIQSEFMNGLSSDQDPSLVWHENELHFFKHRVQPLAAEFKACGFGNDYIARAEENFNEWQHSGHKATQKLTMDKARNKDLYQHEALQDESQPGY